MYVMPTSEVRESNSITTDSTAKLFLWPPHAPLTKTVKIIYPFPAGDICSGHSRHGARVLLNFLDKISTILHPINVTLIIVYCNSKNMKEDKYI